MAIFFDAPVSPDALTAFIRGVPTPSEFALSNTFDTVTEATNTVDFAEIVRTNRTARYRAFDGRIHVAERDTGSEKRVKLAPLSTSLSMGELERLQLEFARTSGTNQQAMAAAIYNDAQNLTREVQARVEQAWGDTLTDGKLSINENGLVSEADYGVPANHIVSASTTWVTIASALALTELLAWVDVYVDTNGFSPGSMQTSQRVQRLLQTNAQIVGAIAGTTSGRTRVTVPELNDLFASEGIPTLRPAYDTRVDIDGVSTRVIADDKLMFFPPNIRDLGYMRYGLSATALELVNSNVADLSFEEAPGIVGVVEKIGPPYREFVYCDAVGQPILANASLLLVADVA